MDIVKYLIDAYGYNTPILLRDIRIGGKSKSSIKEDLYRAVKAGKLVRDGHGIYFIPGNKQFGNVVTFEKVLETKFINPKNISLGIEYLNIQGYYSGLTFLNMIGISTQVPAILDVTTNKTKSKKRLYIWNKMWAYIRKPRTTITSENYKILQFLDMFYYIEKWEFPKYKKRLKKYIINNKFTKEQFNKYIQFYDGKTLKNIQEMNIEELFE